MSAYTGTWKELLYASTAVATAKASFTSEAQINDTAGMGVQAKIPKEFWLPNQNQAGRGIGIVARGILSSTATPTYQPRIRLGAAGSTTACQVGGAPAALTTGSGVTNQFWELVLEAILVTRGADGANSTIRGIGHFISPGLATTISPIYGGGATPGTDATLDCSIDNYVNFNMICSASSASNTIQLQQLLVYGLN